MILVPYFWKINTNWSTFGIFLCEGARSLWSVDDKTTPAAAKKMLIENGFPVIQVTKTNGVLYAEISQDLNLAEFYVWDEMPLGSDEDMWRIFNIPMALWSCPIFKEIFCKESNLPEVAVSVLIDKVRL